MRKFFFPIFLVPVLFASTIYSQGLRNEIKVYRPDFSGTWNLNFVKSALEDIESQGLSDEQLILTIDQKLPVISVKITALLPARSEPGPEFAIYIDGRVSSIPTAHAASSATAEWNGGKLIMTVVPSPKDGNSVVVEAELSADRNTLILTLIRKLKRTGPDGKSIIVVGYPRDITMIYDRITGIPARSNKTPLPEEK